MTTLIRLNRHKTGVTRTRAAPDEAQTVRTYFAAVGADAAHGDALVAHLPFGVGDVTVGTENELQTAVRGEPSAVDLPRTIYDSDYYAESAAQAHRGPRARALHTELKRYLESPDRVWESSWVRFPLHALNAFGRAVFEHDLRADKHDPQAGRRVDAGDFWTPGTGELRVPVSYLLKLALANVLGDLDSLPLAVRRTGVALLEHFINDNTSPEQHSAYISLLAPALGLGRAVARENAARFLLTQALLAYANDALGLRARGQEVSACFAALPPVRQRHLAAAVSDTFYRKLFMNPCLSGWNRGEDKRRYMHLCHEVLSRSRMQAVCKLQDLGIADPAADLLDFAADTSLANNGTHVSLGSRRLSRALAEDPRLAAPEKRVGDLAIKLFEHFLPLFVGTYSAAPRWLAPVDREPARLLGFLPHQLASRHVRMLWHAWTATPGRRYMPDGRLMDYFVSLPSTSRHPALNGEPGSGDRLKRALAEQGVFDERMPLYLAYRLREHATMGYSGFEGRYYSIFPSLARDLGPAVELQALVTAFAMKSIALGQVTHAAIPDDPEVESERRQFLFAAAMGLSHGYVARDTRNTFLMHIVRGVDGVRASARFPGYLAVPLDPFRLGLLRVLRAGAADLIEAMSMDDTLRDLSARVSTRRDTAAGRLGTAVIATAGLGEDAAVLNRASERYLREDLRRSHVSEAFDLLCASGTDTSTTRSAFLVSAERALRENRASGAIAVGLIEILLSIIHADAARHGRALGNTTITDDENESAPIYRTGNG